VRGREVEVLVVGGGPAGLVAALEARRRGLSDVVVLDRGRPPIDKACGEGVMPDGVARLAELGVEIDPARSAPFRGIRYVDGELAAAGRFPRGHGLGVRRTALHEALVRRAEECGVELRWRVRVGGLLAGGAEGFAGVETSQGPLSARWIVAADGLNSRLRSWAGLAAPAPVEGRRRRFGVRRHFRLLPWSELVEVHWSDGVEAYVTPVGPEEVGVAMLWSGGPARFGELLARFPPLAGRLAGAPTTSRTRGAGPLAQRVRRVTAGRLALLGDASGYVDAITGEGLSLAFHQAAALARALAAGDLASYRRAHRAIGRLPNAITRAVLALERRPRLRRRLLATLAADPELFGRLLGIHSRAFPLRRLGLPGALRLAWGAAAAILPLREANGLDQDARLRQLAAQEHLQLPEVSEDPGRLTGTRVPARGKSASAMVIEDRR
jgi:flavin-dependent dehydrogenase